MNWLRWIGWVLQIALNLIGNIDRLRTEVPEAWQGIHEARTEILGSLSGGLTPDEVDAIKLKLLRTWAEIDDVFRILRSVIPTGIKLGWR
ncbi:MAG: hypothetical protein ABIH46_04080 [Chloroflexota bacterium]